MKLFSKLGWNGAESASSAPLRRSASFNYAVNGFRGVCILLVFAFHVYNSGLLPKPPYASSLANALGFFFSSFRYGVELFFMISGYVIVASLKRHRSIGSFLWDRFARIFPVWIPVHVGIFVIGAIFGLKRFMHMDVAEKVQVFFANLVLLPPLVQVPMTNDVSWSLSYEWLFYLVSAAALAITYLRMNTARMLLYVTWATLVVVLLCYLPRALFFIPGAIIGLGWVPLQKLTRGLRFPIPAMLLFLVAWRWVNIDEAAPGAYAVSDFLGLSTLPMTLLSLLLGFYAFACVCLDNERVKWLQHGIAQFFGSISYSFYLWHPVVMFAVKPVARKVGVEFGMVAGVSFFAIVSLIGATAVAYVSYRVFEVRVSKVLRQWFQRRNPPAATLTVRSDLLRGGEL